MKSKPWQILDGNKAYCLRCGGKSIYHFTRDWYSFSSGYGCDYTFFKWWKGFKKAHKNCPDRRKQT